MVKLGLENIYCCTVPVYLLFLLNLCCTHLQQYAALRIMGDKKLLQAILRSLALQLPFFFFSFSHS